MFEILMDILEGLQKGANLTELYDDIVDQLLEAKVSKDDVEKFLESMQRISELQATVQRLHPVGGFPVRIYAPIESLKLDAECRGYLLQLEQDSMLPPPLREIVIDQALRLDEMEVTLDRLRLLVTIVLFNQAGVESVLDYYTDHTSRSAQTLH